MLRSHEVATGPDFTVRMVRCTDDHRGWSAPEARAGHGLVLVRRGRFRRLVAGVASDVDPTLGYLMAPGEEERFAHPAGGDVCTWVSLGAALWHSVAGEQSKRGATVYVDARLDLAHRRMLGATADPGYALTEQLLTALALALRPAGPVPVNGSTRRDSALVAAAREAITSGHPRAAALRPLAELLGVSPYRLSRVFSRELGVSLTRYRNRVRLGRALDRLEEGEENLAALAADLGFADQAHLCRTMRAEFGHTPAGLRRLLGAAR